MSQSDHLVLRCMASNMRNKYDKHWGSIEKIIFMIFISVVTLLHFWIKKNTWWQYDTRNDSIVETTNGGHVRGV